ncbi:MAG: hypothetical protein JXR07_02565 [Reichenbachiella sp.]
MKKILLPIWIVCCVLLYGCKDNVVCPAFQSTYILNDSIRMARYSLFLNDSTPKFAMASRRTKNGVNKKTNLFIKNYEMMTAPKKNVLGPPEKDPLYYHEPEPEFLASDFAGSDSLGMDSVRVVPEFAVTEDDGPKYKYRYHPNNSYNQEQEYYNKYFGELFLDNRPPPPTPEELAAQLVDDLHSEEDSTVVEEKKKGLFKKKEKEPEEEEEGEVDAETLEKAKEQKEEEAPVPSEDESE